MEELIRKFESLRKSDYARLGEQVYLDHTGTALYTSTHLEKYFNELQNNIFGNPHSGNSCSERTHDVVYQVRSKILQFFSVTGDDYDVVFTSGATEGLHTVGSSFNWCKDSIFAYLEDNHTSVVGIREIACENAADSYCLSLKKSSHKANTSSLESYSSTLVKTSSANRCKKFVESGNVPCLFAYPAQSNFSGAKYPLQWIEQVQKFGINCTTSSDAKSKTRKWYVLCDAAAFVSTSPMNLQQYPADFVTVSFYKIFGFPTGLGALLVRKEVQDVLCIKDFFGGGSVSGWLASHDFCQPKPVLHERLEDGSVPFLNILALKYGFDTFKELGISMHFVQKYTQNVWKYLYEEMSSLRHANGMPVAEIYTVHDDADFSNQGPILAFNVRRSDGSYIGFNTVLQLANSNDIYLRGGCFCNVGACGFMLNASNDLLLKAYESGHVCGDGVDIMDGKPIGALRASLGTSSTKSDIKRFVEFISSCFREDKIPSSSNGVLKTLNKQGDIVLEKIIIYPVKSCQGMAVDNWEISKTGLKCDRMWMIVDDHGICINLKKNPALVSIYPVVLLPKQILILKADGMKNMEVPFIYDDDISSTNCSIGPDQRCMTKVCGDRVEGHDCGEEVSLWLSEVLGTKCSLIQKRLGMCRYSKSKSKVHDDFEISLANEAQYLLVNLSSVQYLYHKMNGHADDMNQEEIKDLARRFRGNFIISGASAFSEDSWSKLSVCSKNGANNGVDGLQFEKRGLCSRCSMICVDPNTGRKLNDPLKSLANLTINKARRKPTFGIYLRCEAISSKIQAKTRLFPEC